MSCSGTLAPVDTPLLASGQVSDEGKRRLDILGQRVHPSGEFEDPTEDAEHARTSHSSAVVQTLSESTKKEVCTTCQDRFSMVHRRAKAVSILALLRARVVWEHPCSPGTAAEALIRKARISS